MDPLVSLIAASVAFVGLHFAMSHPLRATMAGALGAGGFMIAYSLVSAATLAWMYFAFVATPAGAPLWGDFGAFGASRFFFKKMPISQELGPENPTIVFHAPENPQGGEGPTS